MKRDMDLVRKALLAIEEHPFGGNKRGLSIEGYSEEQVNYNLLLMTDAGLIEGLIVSRGEGVPVIIPQRMTWQGHDFLEASRDEGRWSKAKGVMAQIGGATLDILKQILAQVMADQVKQVMGIQP